MSVANAMYSQSQGKKDFDFSLLAHINANGNFQNLNQIELNFNQSVVQKLD